MPIGGELYLRVTITCSDGQVDTDFHHITSNYSNRQPCNDTIPELQEKGYSNLVNSASDVSVFPHPVKGFLNLKINLETKSNVEIRLIDVMGRKVRTLAEKTYGKGIYNESFDLSLLNSGYYLIRFQIGNKSDNQISSEIMKSNKLVILTSLLILCLSCEKEHPTVEEIYPED